MLPVPSSRVPFDFPTPLCACDHMHIIICACAACPSEALTSASNVENFQATDGIFLSRVLVVPWRATAFTATKADHSPFVCSFAMSLTVLQAFCRQRADLHHQEKLTASALRGGYSDWMTLA
jgi:hypothetical protein